MAIDETKLNDFMGRFVGDLGAVMHAATIVVGDQLGLYKRLADGPTAVESLARLTETDSRYLREWLSAQAASGLCLVPCDHVPIRSWPLFRAREIMPALIASIKQGHKP